MHFASEDHADTYEALASMAQVGRDREFQAALYVLAAIRYKHLRQYVEPGGIRITALMEDSKPWSTSEKALVRLAATLFNSGAWPVPVGDIFYSLDETNTGVALEALSIRYQGA
jgi:hypothetical protein